MATMIPVDIAEFKTEGEGRFYAFLEQVARPHQFVLAMGGKRETKKNPIPQARDYQGSVMGGN